MDIHPQEQWNKVEIYKTNFLSWTIAGDETCSSALGAFHERYWEKPSVSIVTAGGHWLAKKKSEIPQGRMFSFLYSASLYSAH